MRGHPTVRLLGVVIIFLLLAIPVWQLTRDRVVMEKEISEKDGSLSMPAARLVNVQLYFSHAPQRFTIEVEGQKIWEGQGLALTWEKDLALATIGADWILRVEWPPHTPRAAVEFKVKDEEWSKEQTFWGKEKLEEVVALP